MNTPSYFEIQASNPQILVNFYTTVFGWSFTKDDSLPIEYYRIQSRGMMGAILKRPAEVPPLESGTNAYICSMQVEDFDAIAETILSAGGRIAIPKFALSGKCWQGYFVDSDNNTFGIYEADENAA